MANSPAEILEGAALPPALRDLPEPPARLFLRGVTPRGPRIGIVGTRHPTREALDYAEQLSSALAARGVAIISGGAKGIDAGAHRGALAVGGCTLVVAPSSFDCPFPAEHRALFEDIVERGGGHVSRHEAGVKALPHHFLQRNADLVAFCHALVVVEAPLRSGARNAAKWARRLGRPCFVVPSPPWNERGRGCIAELQLGGRALAGPEELLHWLHEQGIHPVSPAGAEPSAEQPAPRTPPRGRRPRRPPQPAGTELENAILGAIDAGARYPEQILEQVDASLPELNHALLALTLGGHITRAPDGELTSVRR